MARQLNSPTRTLPCSSVQPSARSIVAYHNHSSKVARLCKRHRRNKSLSSAMSRSRFLWCLVFCLSSSASRGTGLTLDAIVNSVSSLSSLRSNHQMETLVLEQRALAEEGGAVSQNDTPPGAIGVVGNSASKGEMPLPAQNGSWSSGDDDDDSAKVVQKVGAGLNSNKSGGDNSNQTKEALKNGITDVQKESEWPDDDDDDNDFVAGDPSNGAASGKTMDAVLNQGPMEMGSLDGTQNVVASPETPGNEAIINKNSVIYARNNSETGNEGNKNSNENVNTINNDNSQMIEGAESSIGEVGGNNVSNVIVQSEANQENVMQSSGESAGNGSEAKGVSMAENLASNQGPIPGGTPGGMDGVGSGGTDGVGSGGMEGVGSGGMDGVGSGGMDGVLPEGAARDGGDEAQTQLSNESGNIVLGGDANGELGRDMNAENEVIDEINTNGVVNDKVINENDNNAPSNPTIQSCEQGTSCGECFNLSISRLKLRSSMQQENGIDPCYWLPMEETTKCVPESVIAPATEGILGKAYECREDGSAVSNISWNEYLGSMAAQGQVPSGGIEGQTPYYDENEGGSFFELVKSTASVILLAAFFSSILVFRSRVLGRQRANPSGGLAGAIKDEVVSLVVALASRAADAARGSGSGVNAGEGGGAKLAGRLPSFGPTDSYNHEAVPLSTATDEEWGWEETDNSPDLELSGIGGDSGGLEMEKEENDLALALALSLSEAKSPAPGPVNGGDKGDAPGSARSRRSVSSSPITTQPVESKPPPSSTSSNQRTSVNEEQTQGGPPLPAPKTNNTIESSASSTGGNSIEELLGQLSTSGGPVITSLGQKPSAPPKRKTTIPKKEENADDIFASMGLSSFPSKAGSGAAAVTGGMSLAKTSFGASTPVSSAGTWQSATTANAAAPVSAPSSSLLADSLDDEDDSWGDDGDLDDLLDD